MTAGTMRLARRQKGPQWENRAESRSPWRKSAQGWRIFRLSMCSHLPVAAVYDRRNHAVRPPRFAGGHRPPLQYGSNRRADSRVQNSILSSAGPVAAGAPTTGKCAALRYSHSIVAGGLELMSSTTRLTPRTSLVMRLEITCSRSGGKRAQSAVMASMLSTTRRAMT